MSTARQLNPTVGDFEPSSNISRNKGNDLNGAVGPKRNGISSVPPHLRFKAGTSGASLPPHRRGNSELSDAPLSPQFLTQATANNPSVDGLVDVSDGQNGASLPPHRRGNSELSNAPLSPQFLTQATANNPLVTDGLVDISDGQNTLSGGPLTPDPLPKAIPNDDILNASVKALSFGPNPMPLYVRGLPKLSNSIEKTIPLLPEMVTFHPDFLRNQLCGTEWSPGLYFVPPDNTACLLKNRTYYLLDPKIEPCLPSKPGNHGAKLTPFFNINPEEYYEEALGNDDISSFEDVPMFVCQKDDLGRSRYVYFGNYSQTRWSDKLDYDRMAELVPQHVKEHWAEELSKNGRPEWITEALMKHFFPQPEYEGRLPRSLEDGSSVTSAEDTNHQEKVMKDLQQHIEKLRLWHKDARLKTSMMKKDSIMKAFDQADADLPTSLRLWWEYLECVDWKEEFYNMLVQLQSRQEYYLK